MLKKSTAFFLSVLFTIIFGNLCWSEDVPEWKQDLEDDYQNVLEATQIKLKRHRGLVRKWQERGRLKDLIKLYESDIAKGSADADIYYGVGYAYLVKTETSKDETALNRAVKNFSRSITSNPVALLAHLSLAKAYKLQGKYQKAIEQYRACLELDNEYYRAHYEIGEIYRHRKKYNKALSEYKKAGKIDMEWAPSFYSMGLIYLDRDETREAEIVFKHVIKLEEEHPLAHFKLGQVYAKQGKVAEALKKYKDGAKYNQPNADTLYRLGKIFADKNKNTYALIEYQKAVKVNPKHAPSHFQMGEVYYAKDEDEKALQHYQAAIKFNPKLEGYFLRKFDRIEPKAKKSGKIDEARVLLDKALLINPKNALAHFKYANLEYEVSNNSEAIRHYEKTIEIDESFVDAYVPLGNRYYEIDQRNKAAQAYRKAVELQPELKNMFLKRAHEAFSQDDYYGAAEKFDKHSLIYPQDASTQYWLGRCYDKLEDFDRSLAYYLKAIKLDATYQDALIELARNYRRRKDTQNMMEVLDRLIKINPEHVQAHYLAGYGYLDLKETDGAIDEFTKVVELEPENSDAHYQLGLLYERSEEIEKAITHYERAIELKPEFAKPYFCVGRIYLARDDKDNVIRVYSRGLQLEPDHPQEQYELALIYEERDELRKAIGHLRLANKFNPHKYDWHFRYARFLDRYTRSLEENASSSENYEKYAAMAVEEYTETIKLNYAYAPAFYYRGLFCRKYKQIGDKFYSYSQIAEDFKQAIELKPEMTDAYYQLGLTYVDMDDRSKAEDIFKKALKIDATYKGPNLQLGLIAQWRKEYDDAIEYYKAEIKNNPESVEAYQQLGYLYSNYKMQMNRAKETLEKALELEPKDVSTLLNYGNTLYNMGRTGSAIEKFEMAVQLEPQNLTANYNLALMYERVKKRQLAIARWKKFLELDLPEQWRMDAQKHLEKLQK